MSDDHRTWKRGKQDMEEIRKAAELLPNGKEIKQLYVDAWNLAHYGHK